MKGTLIEPDKLRVSTKNVADALELITALAYMPLTHARIDFENGRYIVLRSFKDVNVTVEVTLETPVKKEG